MLEVPVAVVHYAVGSAYVLAHLALGARSDREVPRQDVELLSAAE